MNSNDTELFRTHIHATAILSHSDWKDFQDVARGYGHDLIYVEVEQGYIILNDADIVADILWAVGVMNQSEDTGITEGEYGWPYMRSVLFSAKHGTTT